MTTLLKQTLKIYTFHDKSSKSRKHLTFNAVSIFELKNGELYFTVNQSERFVSQV